MKAVTALLFALSVAGAASIAASVLPWWAMVGLVAGAWVGVFWRCPADDGQKKAPGDSAGAKEGENRYY